MGLRKSKCDVPSGTTQGQDCLRNVSFNKKKRTVLDESIFENFEVKSLEIHGFITHAKRE
jgi:hypothetical protein